MYIQNDNISFTGLGIVGKVNAQNLPELTNFIANPNARKNITFLEKKYSLDVFVNTKANMIFLKHRKNGYLSKYGMDKCSTKDFVENFTNLIENVEKAMQKIAQEQEKYSEWLDGIFHSAH